MVSIENEQLSIRINPKGAELDHLFNKQTKLEYLWNADPAIWAKKSPVLFPIVGTLKENCYYYEGQVYQLSRHGFARDLSFDIEAVEKDEAVLSLHSSLQTLTRFPFDFVFRIRYRLSDATVFTSYEVSNTGNKTMYFSVGGHPAFRLPLVEGTEYEDYELVFNKTETAGRWPISKDGLIEREPVPLLQDTDRLQLKRSLFYKDAIVLKHLRSSQLSLCSHKTGHGLTFRFDGFPYLGLWAAKDADFLCIEPWCGIADSTTTDQDITGKEGIESLAPAATFRRTWSVTLF